MSEFREPYGGEFYRPGDSPYRDLSAMGVRSVLEYSEIDQTGVRDCTDVLNQAFTDAIANDFEVRIPAGEYRTTGPLIWPGPFPRIQGGGAGLTVIRTDSTEYSALTVGPGATGQHPIPGAWVRDISIICAAEEPSPAGDTAAIKLDGALFTQVARCNAHFYPIGFDIVNNGYGSSFDTIRTFFGECRIGMLLRGEIAETLFIGGGSDISIFNGWIHGGDCALWVEGNQGNYHLFGGQLAGGFNMTPSDDRGVITAGKSFTTGLPMGSCGITLHSVSFERIHNGWGVRYFGPGTFPAGFSLICSGKTSFMGGDGAYGIWKITGGWNDRVSLDFCNVGPDTFSSSDPCIYASPGTPGTARSFVAERGTSGVATFGGVSRNLNDWSALNFSPTVPYMRSQGAMLDFNTGRTVFWTPEGLVATDERGEVGFTDEFVIAPSTP